MTKNIKTGKSGILSSGFSIKRQRQAILLIFINMLFSCHSPNKFDIGNVRNFGAIGDGKADDSYAIQKAVDASVGAVYLPKGLYRITKPIVVNLDKTGYTSVNGEGVAQIIMTGPGPAFRFIGTHFKSADPGTFSEDVWDRQRMPIVDGIAITGNHAEAVGIEAGGTMQLTLNRILIRKVLHGVHLVGTNRNIIISDCHIYDNNGIGIYYDNVNLHQSNIIGCHISYNKGGGIVSKGGAVRNIQITGCDIESNMDPDMPPAANVFIDCSGSTIGTAEVSISGCTLQHNNTSAGSANVRIIGSSMPGPGTDLVRWGNVCITGNLMSDVKVNVNLRECHGVVITGNTFWQGYEHNILIEGCSDIVAGTNNFDQEPSYFNSGEAMNSLKVINSRDCTFSGLHITNVRRDQAAFLIENCSRINITGCTILDFDNVGLLLRNVSFSRVSDCLIRDDRPGSKSIPVKITGGKGNMIVDNLK